MQDAAITREALEAFDELQHELGIFMDSVATWFQTNPRLSRGSLPIVHSVKKRAKDREHLREKIERKSSPDRRIDGDSLSREVTDLTGVRVLHMHLDQITQIHAEIMNKVHVKGDWYLHEQPRAYTWDQESSQFFHNLNFDVVLKPSSYTSVHYVVRPKSDSNICCEIQVRTLFEEVWGEVDHVLNYPKETSIVACREQLRVLAKVVGAGTRLVDSIFRSIPESQKIVAPETRPANASQLADQLEQPVSRDVGTAPIPVPAVKALDLSTTPSSDSPPPSEVPPTPEAAQPPIVPRGAAPAATNI